MFGSRRGGVAQAFRNNQQLQQFVLTDVTATEKVLGTGSYGSVVEVYKQALSRYSYPLDFAGEVQTTCLCWQEAP